MATTVILGSRATLSIASSATGTFTPIAQLSKLTAPTAKASYADISNLGSPAYDPEGTTPSKEVAPTIIDPGTATITGFLVPNGGDPGQTMVIAAFGVQTLMYFKITYALAAGQTTPATQSFSAYVSTRPSMDATLTDAVSFDFTLQVTGAVTYTTGATS